MPKYDYLLKNWNEAGLTPEERDFMEMRFKMKKTFDSVAVSMKMDLKNLRNLEISAIKKLRKYSGISDTMTIDDITFEKNLFFVKRREYDIKENASGPKGFVADPLFYSDNLEDADPDDGENSDEPEDEEE